jgi:hypothetical protein
MQPRNNYAVFILSHGRANNVVTYKTLRRQGYSGKIYIIVDDDDKQLNDYKNLYGDQVIVFSKDQYMGTFDMMDNFDGKDVIVFARNACYDIARSLQLDYFFEYEDDYKRILYRWPENNVFRGKSASQLDMLFDHMIECIENTGLYTIAFAQGGDFIGGLNSMKHNRYKRKAMNSFLFKVNANPKNDIKFIGRMNDDVNTYLTFGKIGALFIQLSNICLIQAITQTNSGGNTDQYKKFGTYVKSFYSVISSPSCCKISLLGTVNKRIHHQISWNHAVPKIISESYKKSK